MEVEVLGNVMTVKSGVMKSGKALIDGTECTLKLTPELLMYESPTKQGSIFLRSIRAVGVDTDELVLDYEKSRFELARIKIKPTSDITLFQKKMEFDKTTLKYMVSGEDNPDFVGGGSESWIIEWYATLGCGRGGVSGFNIWDEEADFASQRGEKISRSLWVSPIAFLYDQVTISDEDYLFQKIYSVWKAKVEIAAKQATFDNPIYPDQIVNFAEAPDFYRDLNLAAILEKKHGLGIDGWGHIDMINIGKYSLALQKDWAKLSYIRFMLGWINFFSGFGYASEYGLWPEEYEKFFLKTGVIDAPFITEEEKRRSKEYYKNVELAPLLRREYNGETLRTFKEWFLESTTSS
jgi:hypothetical protein